MAFQICRNCRFEVNDNPWCLYENPYPTHGYVERMKAAQNGDCEKWGDKDDLTYLKSQSREDEYQPLTPLQKV